MVKGFPRTFLLFRIDDAEKLSRQFRDTLVREMMKRGLTVVDVARAYGCSVEKVCQLLGGPKDLQLATTWNLCKAIGIRSIYFVTGRETSGEKEEVSRYQNSELARVLKPKDGCAWSRPAKNRTARKK